MNKLYVMIVVLAVLGMVGAGAVWYYNDTQARIATLRENNAKLEVAVQTAEESINTLQETMAQVAEANQQLQTQLQRAEEYGDMPFDPTPAPLRAGFKLGSGLFTAGERKIMEEPDAFVPAARAAQTYLPGVANVDRVLRMTTGERLFEKLGLLED